LSPNAIQMSQKSVVCTAARGERGTVAVVVGVLVNRGLDSSSSALVVDAGRATGVLKRGGLEISAHPTTCIAT